RGVNGSYASLDSLTPFVRSAQPESAVIVIGRIRRDECADFDTAAIRHVSLVAVGCREVIYTALKVGAAQQLSLSAARRLADLVGLQVLLGIVFDGLAGLGINAVRPVELLGILLRRHELPIGTVQPIEEAIAAKMGDDLAVLAINL